jgi:hypothetical protein
MRRLVGIRRSHVRSVVYGRGPFSYNETQAGKGDVAMKAVFSNILNFPEPLDTPKSSPVDDATKAFVAKFCAGLVKNRPTERMRPEKALLYLL